MESQLNLCCGPVLHKATREPAVQYATSITVYETAFPLSCSLVRPRRLLFLASIPPPRAVPGSRSAYSKPYNRTYEMLNPLALWHLTLSPPLILPSLLTHVSGTKACRLFLHCVIFPPFHVLINDTLPDPLTPYFEFLE